MCLWQGSKHAALRSESSLGFVPFEAAMSSFSGALAVPNFPSDVLTNISIVVSNMVLSLIAPWIDVCMDGAAVPMHSSDEDSMSSVNVLRSTCVEYHTRARTIEFRYLLEQMYDPQTILFDVPTQGRQM